MNMDMIRLVNIFYRHKHVCLVTHTHLQLSGTSTVHTHATYCPLLSAKCIDNPETTQCGNNLSLSHTPHTHTLHTHTLHTHTLHT